MAHGSVDLDMTCQTQGKAKGKTNETKTEKPSDEKKHETAEPAPVSPRTQARREAVMRVLITDPRCREFIAETVGRALLTERPYCDQFAKFVRSLNPR